MLFMFKSQANSKYSVLAIVYKDWFNRLSVIVLLNNSAVQKHQNWIKIIYPCYWLFHFQFIPWKKKYFLLKNSDSSSEDEMIKLLDENGLLEVDLFPRNLAW